MSLPTPLALVLVVSGLWSILVWPSFLKEVMKSPRARDESGAPTRYLTTSLMKISSAMVFGLAVVVIGIRGLAG